MEDLWSAGKSACGYGRRLEGALREAPRGVVAASRRLSRVFSETLSDPTTRLRYRRYRRIRDAVTRARREGAGLSRKGCS
jgi:hypothetical protein